MCLFHSIHEKCLQILSVDTSSTCKSNILLGLHIIYNLKSTWRKSAHFDSTQMNIFRQWQQSSILYLKIISQQDNDQVYSKIEVFDPC